MKKLKQLYTYNAIIRFAVSYLVVLIIPLIICVYGTYISLQTIEKSIESSNFQMMEYTSELLDREMTYIHTLALQISNDNDVVEFSRWTDVDNEQFFWKCKELLEHIQGFVKFRGTRFLENIDIVFLDNNSYFNSNYGYYKTDFYYKWKSNNTQLEYNEWLNIYSGSNGQPTLYYSNNVLQYIVPMDNHKGAIICNFDMIELKQCMEAMLIEEKGNVFLVNEQGDLYYSLNQENILGKNLVEDMNQNNGILFENGQFIIYKKADISGMYLVKIVPKNDAMKELNQLIYLDGFLIVLALIGGLVIVVYESKRKGKVINEFFNTYSEEKKQPYTLENIGSVAQKLVNGQEYILEVLEREKPLLELALLGKLIRGEVIGDSELQSLQQRVNFDIDSNSYQVIVYRIFHNVDFYDADSQTIEEARIISCYIQNLLKELIGSHVWLYEINYLTTVVVYKKDDNSSVHDLVKKINQHLKEKGEIQPFWGAASKCTDIINLWRSTEEARLALEHVTESTKEHLLTYEDVSKLQKGYYYPEQFEERLENCIRANDREQVHNLLKVSQEENFIVRHLTRNQFLKLNTHFINTLANLGSQDRMIDHIKRLNEFAIHYGKWNQEEYYTCLTNAIEELCDILCMTKKSKSAHLVDQMICYVQNNYGNSNLGLAMMSQVFDISEGYVSMVFKEHAGINFADYVEKQRIEKACVLLKETRISIQDISEQVGYNSIQSFRRAFKKLTGLTPKAMREQE